MSLPTRFLRLWPAFPPHFHTSCPPNLSSPVHDERHLGGEAAAAVHAQVPGHARVRAHVGLQRRGLLEHPAAFVALKRALLVYAPVRCHAVDGGEGALAELAFLRFGAECCCCRLPIGGSLEAQSLGRLCRLCRLVPQPHFLQNAGLAAFLVLGLEVHALVLQEVLGRLEQERALRALVRVQHHYLSRPLRLVATPSVRQYQLGRRGSAQR